MRNRYPDCFPANIEELIIQDGAGENEFPYYRVCNNDKIDRDAFKGTYEESLTQCAGGHNRDMYLASKETTDIGDYSTSGFEKLRDAKNILKCKKKYHNGPIIAVGKTVPSCGLSMRTKDSKTRKKKNSHIDWWIYKEAHPEVFFERYIEDPGGENNAVT